MWNDLLNQPSLLVSLTWPEDALSNTQMLLRWLHFLAGITWIGLLYFFNLVNVNFMKALEAPTRTKVIPELMPRALFWFRWGAVVTWLSGFIYYMIIVGTEGTTGPSLALLVVWIVVFAMVYALVFQAPKGGALNKGNVLGLIIAVIVVIAMWITATYSPDAASSRSVSIGIGGGLGTVMLLNVWGVIWPLQKKIIAATIEAGKGTPAPADQPKWARTAFLASRTNTWLSVPMLFFMGAASHFPIFGSIPQM